MGNMGFILRILAVLLCAIMVSASASGIADPWIPDHIVMVILENRSFDQAIGDPNMPYLNTLAKSGALMTQSYFGQTPYGIVPGGAGSVLPARPSQPNYLYLMSGNNQAITPEWFRAPRSPYRSTAICDEKGNRLRRPAVNVPVGIGNNLIPSDWRPFMTPNLGAALFAAGRKFACFSESLPHPHYDGPEDVSLALDLYRRKHNPAINWVNLTGRRVPRERQKFLLPVEANLSFLNTADPLDGKKYRGFSVDADGRKIGFDQLPTVSFVVPNEQNDLHSASNAAGDIWLQANIRPYAEWARTHNSLLIVTFDEDGAANSMLASNAYRTGIDRIPTILFGQEGKVIPGAYDETIDHLNILSTILDRYGLLESFKQDFLRAYQGTEATNQYANLRPIRDVFGEGPKLAMIRMR